MVKACKHGFSHLVWLSKLFGVKLHFQGIARGRNILRLCIMNNSLHHGRFLQLVQDVHCREHGNGLPETTYVPIYVRLAVSLVFFQNRFGVHQIKA